MTFEEILDQALGMLQRRGRVTYRTLQRQFRLDEDALTDLKEELLFAHPQVRDEEGRGLVWTDAPGTAPPALAPGGPPALAPLAYTPPYLAEKILAARPALAGERSRLTPRELEVLQLICNGLSNKDIAAKLKVSANTIAVHRANIMNALGVHKTAELVMYAIQNGLVTPPQTRTG